MRFDYAQAKHIARYGNYRERAALASDARLPPELSVFLAADSSPAVRMALAHNVATHAKAIEILARDPEEMVRVSLARKIAPLLPERIETEADSAKLLALRALEQLALDQALKVREALATALRDVALAPPKIVRQLALDVAQSVAEPILRFCARLSDDDLIAALAQHNQVWARVAVAQRPVLSTRVSAVLVSKADTTSTETLLKNPKAQLDAPTLAVIVEQAPAYPQWHQPLALRPELPAPLALKLASFVDERVIEILQKRSDYDVLTIGDIVATARRRLDHTQQDKNEHPYTRAARLFRAGALNEQAISDALSWHERDFVVASLSLLARIEPAIVEKMISANSAKAVTALAWRAGLSMRGAMQLQRLLANIAPALLLNARGGSDFPLNEVEMLWQLQFFGVKAE